MLHLLILLLKERLAAHKTHSGVTWRPGGEGWRCKKKKQTPIRYKFNWYSFFAS